MTATSLSTARPAKAAIAWAHGDAIFVEIPHKDGGPPFICRYRRSVDGLASALNVLIEHADAPYSRPVADPNASHPAIKRKSKVNASEDQREAARLALRKIGLL